MKWVKKRQEECENSKQTKNMLEEEQHLQDAGEAAASLCVSVQKNVSERSQWLSHSLGQGEAKEPFPAGKRMWGGETSGIKISALQELHPELPLPEGTECILATCTLFHSVPPKHCCCPAHFNAHGKLFSSRCSYLELNNCLQLHEHHVRNTNKGTKPMNSCSIMLWLTAAKNVNMHWSSTHSIYRHSSLGFCLSKSSTKLWTPLIFRFFQWFELVVTPLWGWAWRGGPGHTGEKFATGKEASVTCAQNDHCLSIFIFFRIFSSILSFLVSSEMFKRTHLHICSVLSLNNHPSVAEHIPSPSGRILNEVLTMITAQLSVSEQAIKTQKPTCQWSEWKKSKKIKY